jgi:hypothetical protein
MSDIKRYINSRDSLHWYKKDGYVPINRYLRTRPLPDTVRATVERTPEQEIIRHVAAIDREIRQRQVPEIELYRGVPPEVFQGRETLYEFGYSSTTTDPAVAAKFADRAAGCCLMKMLVDASDEIFGYPFQVEGVDGESEVVLQRNLKFIATGETETTSDGLRVIHFRIEHILSDELDHRRQQIREKAQRAERKALERLERRSYRQKGRREEESAMGRLIIASDRPRNQILLELMALYGVSDISELKPKLSAEDAERLGI